jgi:ATP-dependent NAD(P)H-hydrate dehydratase
LQKGAQDIISNGTVTYTVDVPGGLKRSGGQGDTLTGALATFLGWRKAFHDGIWPEAKENQIDEKESFALAAFAGSCVARESSRLAFAERGRSLQAGDLTDKVETAYNNLFEEKGPKL